MNDQPYPPPWPQPPLRPQRRATPWPLIIAVVLLVVLVAILAVILLGRSGDDLPEGSGDPSPATSSPDASVASSSPDSSSPTSSASAGAGSGFLADAIVATAVEALTLRETAGLDGEAVWRLPDGTLGFVIAGPVDADGLTWYQLSGMGLPYASGCVTPEPGELLDGCPAWLGWVAAEAEDGTAYLTAAEPPACAEPPPTLESLSEMGYTSRLVYFDDEPLTFRGWWPEQPDDGGAGGACAAAEAEVGWLVCQNINDNGLSGDPSEPGDRLTVTVDPASGVEMPARDQWIEVTGHFDDAAAQRCGEVAEVMSSDRGALVFDCRLQFVLSAAAPTSAP